MVEVGILGRRGRVELIGARCRDVADRPPPHGIRRNLNGLLWRRGCPDARSSGVSAPAPSPRTPSPCRMWPFCGPARGRTGIPARVTEDERL